MKKILFTGFDPFDKDTTNPSWDAVSMLPDEAEGVVIVKRHLPVEYDSMKELLHQAIEEEQPDAVICVGQAGGRTAVTPERVAINLKEASIPDNAGVSYDGTAICPDGPDAYFATIPVKEIVSAMREAGVPASLSYTAGAYVCNSAMYSLLHMIAHEYPKMLGGFIHVPYECNQVLERPSYGSLPLGMIAAALEAAAKTTAKYMEENA